MKLFVCIEDKEHIFWVENEAEEEILAGIGHLSCPWCDSLCRKVEHKAEMPNIHVLVRNGRVIGFEGDSIGFEFSIIYREHLPDNSIKGTTLKEWQQAFDETIGQLKDVLAENMPS